MASAFSHAVVAVALGTAVGSSPPRRFWWLSAACAVVPDVDVVAFPLGISYGDVLGHRGLTHSLSFALVLAVLVVTVWFPNGSTGSRDRRILIAHFFLVTASHGLLDAMTSGGLGVAFFAPFVNDRYFLPWRPILVSPVDPRQFMSSYGLRVLANEVVWVWIPAAGFAGAAIVFRKTRGRRARSTTVAV